MTIQAPTLAVIVNEAMTLEQMLVESGGVITPEIENALKVNAALMTDKVDGYVHMIERFEDLEAHYKRRAEFFLNISKQMANATERLKNNIKFGMKELGVDELKGTDMRIKLTATKGSLEITDAEMIPVKFKTETIVTEIDKKALKDALIAGEEINGAELIAGYSLRAYANTPEKKSKKVAVNE